MPATAKASIFHRVTGVALFFALTFVIWAWSESLSSPEGFEFVKELFSGFIAKLIAVAQHNTFWEYFSESLYKMTTAQKTTFMKV